MINDELLRELSQSSENNQQRRIALPGNREIELYPWSLNFIGDTALFTANEDGRKWLSILDNEEDSDLRSRFCDGQSQTVATKESCVLTRCPQSHHNAAVLRELFEFTRPVCIGLADSFGLGDRLGIANPAHLRAVRESHMRPVLAQQSIREMQRTGRRPDDVMDAATWAVFQEGYKKGFGADADHLKTPADIDTTVKAGFTMFTIDPGEYVVNEADFETLDLVEARILNLPWEVLDETAADFVARYTERTFEISDELRIEADVETAKRGLLKYGGVIAHAIRMHRYFKENYPAHPAEFELSVDETDSVTSPFEHFMVANELHRRGIELVSLAPRFVGDFEKGIDYRGDLETFRMEYLKHAQIARYVGPYKLSIHSGSDKFSVYEAIGSLRAGPVHVKTAGTSYLEALRTVASEESRLFAEILDFAREHFENEKRTYHVSANLENVPAAPGLDREGMLTLFDHDDARQVLHVTFGKVLTEVTAGGGKHQFRDRIMDCLNRHEDVHYQYLYQHFRKHMRPFEHEQ